MNWPPDAFIYMKVGPNGGETLDEILFRKKREFEKARKIFWSCGSRGALHPKTQVQPFAREWTQMQRPVYVLMERLNSRGRGSGPPAGTATEYSVNGVDWKRIPEGIQSGPGQYALVLDEITPVDRELNLGDFEVGIGPSKGKNATDFITGQSAKGCLVAAGSTSDRPSKPIYIKYQARLLAPYAVLLRGQG